MKIEKSLSRPVVRMLAAALALSSVLGVKAADVEGGNGQIVKRPMAQVLNVDVVQNPTEFFFEGATTETGVPAIGTPFVTTGFIYPAGTLASYGADRGITADGAPEFPELVLGKWTCRGWHVQDGDAQSGVVVVTSQTFDFDAAAPGAHMVVTNGIELADFNVPFARPIVGGSGKFGSVRGEMSQTYLGFNTAGGFNMTFESTIR